MSIRSLDSSTTRWPAAQARVPPEYTGGVEAKMKQGNAMEDRGETAQPTQDAQVRQPMPARSHPKSGRSGGKDKPSMQSCTTAHYCTLVCTVENALASPHP
eukprot:366259-Chlamydomonas_euryale.AAC.22